VRFSFVFFIAAILAVTGYSCKEKGEKHLNQGEIHYNIEYKGEVGSVPREVLPKNLIVSFKKDKKLNKGSDIEHSGIRFCIH
jgi:hypothetical protein